MKNISVSVSCGSHEEGTKFYNVWLFKHGSEGYVIKNHGPNNRRGKVILEPYIDFTYARQEFRKIKEAKEKRGYNFNSVMDESYGYINDGITETDTKNLAETISQKFNSRSGILFNYADKIYDAIRAITRDGEIVEVIHEPALKETIIEISRDDDWGSW